MSLIKDVRRCLRKLNSDLGRFYIEGYTKSTCTISGILECPISKLETERFSIKIEIPLGYPYCVPSLFEVGNRYNFRDERHFNFDGSCCVEIPAVLRRQAKVGLSIDLYLNQFVIPFFQNQIFYDVNGYFNSEYSHGDAGILEHVQSLLGTKDRKEVEQWSVANLSPPLT